MSEIRQAAEKALEQVARAAMGSGVACFTERLRAGKVDPAAPISEAFGDFPRDFIYTRQDLTDAVLDAVTPLIRAEVLRDLAERASTAERRLTELSRKQLGDYSQTRLSGKAQGVGLVLSYIEEASR